MKRFLNEYPVLSVMILMLLCLAPLMAMRDFTPANELRYLSIADEAISDGHVFAFYNHGSVYADKPPLYFWIIMLCRLIFGSHSMFVLSLFSLIPTFVIMGTMDRWMRDACICDSPHRRAASAMLLGTMGLFLGMSVFLRMDMLMCMWVVLALYAFYRGKPGMFAFHTFMALFTKGPVGLLVPPLTVLACLLSSKRGKELGKWFGWRFWCILGGSCIVWFTGVFLDGGMEYLDNLLVHQTVGRAVNSFHHKAPIWFYLLSIWEVAAPWCLLIVPTAILSFLCKGGYGVAGTETRSETERIWAWTVAVTFVMLSAFSSKLAIYLAPLFPFLAYLFVAYESRTSWQAWMKWALMIPSALLAIVGLALVAAVCIWDMIPALEPYSFARSGLTVIAGVAMFAGGLYACLHSRDGWEIPVLSLGAALLLTVLVLSFKMPQVNPLVGYRSLCEDISAVERSIGCKDVTMYKVYRPENVDVYLGHEVEVADAKTVTPSEAVSLPGIVVMPARLYDSSMPGSCRKSGDYVIIY